MSGNRKDRGSNPRGYSSWRSCLMAVFLTLSPRGTRGAVPVYGWILTKKRPKRRRMPSESTLDSLLEVRKDDERACGADRGP